MNDGYIPIVVHGGHAQISAFDVVAEMVDNKLKERQELGDKAPYAYTLGFTESRLACILNTLKYHHPEVFDEIMEDYFNV